MEIFTARPPERSIYICKQALFHNTPLFTIKLPRLGDPALPEATELRMAVAGLRIPPAGMRGRSVIRPASNWALRR